MLTVTIHAGASADACEANALGWLQIAQMSRGAIVDFKVLAFLRGVGVLAQALITEYPRWSASLLDLVARGIAVSFERKESLPTPPLEKKCAYARRCCMLVDHQGYRGPLIRSRLVTMDVEMTKRGVYAVRVEEDILGARGAEHFLYRPQVLNPWMLAAYACTAALHGKAELPSGPVMLIPPATRAADGTPCIDPSALAEPAATGLARWQFAHALEARSDGLVDEESYAKFLQVTT